MFISTAALLNNSILNHIEMIEKFFRRYLPITSFVVSCTALMFQLTVLYPWHHELDAEFKQLKQVKDHQDQKLEEYNAKKMVKIEELEGKLDYLRKLEL
jgi:hypothetical protein